MAISKDSAGKGRAMKTGDRLFWTAITVLVIFHVDVWGWDRVHPVLLGWIPYHLWYDAVLTLAGALFFFWWGSRRWPDPPENLETRGQ